MVPSGAWAGPKVVSLDSLVEHYALQLDPSRTLTALQVRQVIAAIILDLHAESGGKRFKGNIPGSRVGDATLRSLTRLFADFEPFGWTAEALEEALRGQNPGVPALRTAHRSWQRSTAVTCSGCVPRRSLVRKGRAISAAEQARLVPPPFGVSSFTFLGIRRRKSHGCRHPPRRRSLRTRGCVTGSSSSGHAGRGLGLGVAHPRQRRTCQSLV